MSVHNQAVSIENSCWISSLNLDHFRNYKGLHFSGSSGPMIFGGKNGAGKTNILEAVSLLSPGKGIRGSALPLLGQHGSKTPWVIHATLELPQGSISLATGIDSLEESRRIVKIQGTSVPHSSLHEWVKILWQTPQSDFLFVNGMSSRRSFLDKLVAHSVGMHDKHLHRYAYALKERSQLLRDHSDDKKWLAVLEEMMAQEAVAITVNRMEFILKINTYGEKRVTTFPQFSLACTGQVELWLEEFPALIVEEKVQESLFENRARDSLVGGSRLGPHQSEIPVINLDCSTPAEVCSTGEQKALLLSLILAQCRLQVDALGQPPLLLLDEVAAHLDEARRHDLFEEIIALGIQAWLTGTDLSVFESLRSRARFFFVDNAVVTES